MPTYCVDLTAYNTAARFQGIGRYGYYLARALHSIRGELRPDERLVAAVRLRGPNAVTDDLRLENSADPLPPVSRRDKAYARYFTLRWLHLVRTLGATKADVVHFIEGPQALPTPARSVVTCHDIIPILRPNEYLRSRKNRIVRRAKDYLRYRTADRIVAISKATEDALVDTMAVPRARIETVLQGVDHERFHPRAAAGERDMLAARYGLPPRYALYVGACDPRKRVDLLLRTYANVYRATGVPLVVVGGWPSSPPKRFRSALAAPPPGALVCAGVVDADHLPAVYRHADVHVLPSVYEGFGLTVLEAMAAGCPVVTTRGGSLAEVGGEAARYVACDSAPELESALVEVLTSAAARDRLRTLGLERAALFTWERTARLTLGAYRRALGRAEG